MIIVVNSSAFLAMRANVGVVEIFLAARYCLMPSPAPAWLKSSPSCTICAATVGAAAMAIRS